ncbi:TonB-dependent receptor domain-containing protein [Asticcacaulis sp. AC466]|uniref:TonB-dependent receptor domain-containing protein n=1 Tax=Asticcacaulis sp. AC466 TaxID=1282362 RepID=UPI0009DDDB8B|nr:TonB-dependent receptor [Asticcacaulis sp. AC466]
MSRLLKYSTAIAVCLGVCVAGGAFASEPLSPGASQDATEGQPAPAEKVKAGKAKKKVDKKEDASAEQGSDIAEVVVTGSRIRRSRPGVTVVNSDLLSTRGAGRLDDTLSALPQVAPMLGEKGSNDPRLGPARINLRRLGAGRTLTLLNGERMSNDVYIIPGTLVERVDILTGGASAVYGSDAIAGVINFIVKKRFNGLVIDSEMSTQESTNDDPFYEKLLADGGYPQPKKVAWGGTQTYTTIAGGHNIAGGKGNISLFAGFRRSEPMKFSMFDRTACPLYMNVQPVPDMQTNDTWSCGFSEYNPYHWFGAGDGGYTNAKDGSRTWRPYDVNDIVRTPQNDYLQRETKTLNAGGFFTYNLTDKITFDTSLLTTGYEQRGQNAQAVNFYIDGADVACDNPLLGAQQAQILCGPDAGVAGKTGTLYAAIFRPDYTNQYNIKTYDVRAAAHLSGRMSSALNFDLSVQRSRRTEKYLGTDIFDWWATKDLYKKALDVVNVNGVPTCRSVVDGSDPNCVPFDVFSSKGPNPDVWKYVTLTGGSRVITEQFVATGAINGTLETYGIKSPWATDAVGYAVVAEHRWNRAAEEGSGAYSWWSRYDNSDSVNELGGELDVPLIQDVPYVKQLSISGGYRLSKYKSIKDPLKTWKMEVNYIIVPGLGFHASVNRAIRQGVLERLQQASPYSGTFRDYCAPPGPGSNLERYSYTQCSSSGMTQAQYDALSNYKACDNNGYCPVLYRPGGNPNLQPETSDSTTIGLAFQPKFLPNFNLTLDYYDINVKGAFNWVRTGIVADQCYNQHVDFYCGLIKRDPTTGAVTEINAMYQNSGFVRNKGYDLSMNYYIPALKVGDHALGSLGLAYNGSFLTGYDQAFAPGAPVYSCLGYFGFYCDAPWPKYRHYASASWGMPWKGRLTLAWRYASSTTNSKLAPNAPLASAPSWNNTDSYPLIPKLPASSYFDLALNYPITKDVELRFNVQNLMDKTPPKVGYADAGSGAWFNTFPQLYDAFGRTIRVGVHAKIW